jgi:hypothetical protein
MATAKKTTTKRKPKPIPAVRYLRYELTNSGVAGTETSHYIDLARDISAINRRLYRQGRAYHVKKVTIVSKNTQNVMAGSEGGRVSVSVVPDSWVARGAWKRGFAMWNRQRKEAVAGSDIQPGTWNDFKVYLSDDMRTGTMLTPLDNGGNSLSINEWNYATLVTPDGTTSSDSFELHMLGDHVGAAGARTSVGLIQSYGDSRTTVDAGQSPNTPAAASDDPLVNIFDDGTHVDEVIDNIEGENDLPPYSVADYGGGATNMPKPIVVQDTVLSDGRSVMGGFHAMCGLLEIESTSPNVDDVYSVLVELAPGNYRGISADVI